MPRVDRRSTMTLPIASFGGPTYMPIQVPRTVRMYLVHCDRHRLVALLQSPVQSPASTFCLSVRRNQWRSGRMVGRLNDSVRVPTAYPLPITYQLLRLAGIEGVAQTVADVVDREHGDKDRRSRDQCLVRRQLQP